jgi:MFS family permease
MAAVELMGRESVDWGAVAALALAGLALAALALRHIRRHPAPILRLDGFAVRSFAVTMGGGSLFRVAVGAVPFLLPLLFQVGFGLDAFRSGLLVLALFLGNVAMKPMTSAILRRFGFKATMVGDCCLAGLSILSLALLAPGTPLGVTLLLLGLAGMTRSMGLTTVNTLAFAEVPQPAMSGANTLFNMFQQLGFGFGVALGALALRFAELWRPAGAAHATPLEFRIAFALVSLAAFAAAADALRLPADAGAEVARGS